MHRIFFLANDVVAAEPSSVRTAVRARCASPPVLADFKTGGAVTTPLVVTAADLKSAARKTIRVVNTHNNNKTEVYEGVPLADF